MLARLRDAGLREFKGVGLGLGLPHAPERGQGHGSGVSLHSQRRAEAAVVAARDRRERLRQDIVPTPKPDHDVEPVRTIIARIFGKRNPRFYGRAGYGTAMNISRKSSMGR